ncbi:hypothetical protein [Nostoc sp.]|uniref:hypothetical protein n=1 Tax=Nostoc sp. TaxID=1180 RepID=UPI002FFA0C9D
MSRNYLPIKIEGDFIDSFIYSGTLFLVNANSHIATYNWEGLLNKVLLNEKYNFFEFLKDCRQYLTIDGNESQEVIYIDEHNLKSQKTGEILPLKGWSTDINVYSNYLYIADETGVEAINFDYQQKAIDPSLRFPIWGEYAYKISPNNGQRLAIAAGINGIITAFPSKNYIKKKDIKIIEIDSCDCEWIGNYLIANSDAGTFISIFDELPKRPEKPDDFFYKNFNDIKKKPPNTQEILNDSNESVAYGWMSGSKLFSLSSDGKLVTRNVDLLNANNSNQTEIKLPISSNILSVRSGLFGAVIEIGDNLFSLTENGVDVISHRPVSWRVFPRAKNYLNHLHIIENDCLIIRAYFVNSSDDSDSYGISFDDVIEYNR